MSEESTYVMADNDDTTEDRRLSLLEDRFERQSFLLRG